MIILDTYSVVFILCSQPIILLIMSSDVTRGALRYSKVTDNGITNEVMTKENKLNEHCLLKGKVNNFTIPLKTETNKVYQIP